MAPTWLRRRIDDSGNHDAAGQTPGWRLWKRGIPSDPKPGWRGVGLLIRPFCGFVLLLLRRRPLFGLALGVLLPVIPLRLFLVLTFPSRAALVVGRLVIGIVRSLVSLRGCLFTGSGVRLFPLRFIRTGGVLRWRRPRFSSAPGGRCVLIPGRRAFGIRPQVRSDLWAGLRLLVIRGLALGFWRGRIGYLTK